VQLSIYEQLLYRNAQRCRRGLVFKARRLLYHSTLGWRVIKKKEKRWGAQGCRMLISVQVENNPIRNISIPKFYQFGFDQKK